MQNVAAALDALQEEITLLEKARSTGLVQAVIRFGADSRTDYLQLAGIIRACLAGREEQPGFEPIRCFDLQGDFRYPETCLAIPRAAVRLPDGTAAAVYVASLQSAEAAASFCVPPTCACPGFYVQNPVEDEGCREAVPGGAPQSRRQASRRAACWAAAHRQRSRSRRCCATRRCSEPAAPARPRW